MESQQEKVYIAVGKNVVEGIGILKWALDHWRSQPVSFIVLQINISSKTFVETSFGKLPCSSVSDEKLEFFRAKEQQRVDKFLSKYYMALCSKVEAEVLKVEAYEEPIHQILVEQITKFGIKKLVMGFKHTRILSWKPSSDTSDSCYVRKHKPEFCKLFIVSGGKQLLPKEENGNGVYFVDESGKIVVDFRKKPKGSLKGLFGRKQTDNASNADETRPSHCVLSPSNAEELIHKWEEEAEEVERYIQGLLAANSLELEQGEESMHKHEVTDAKMIQSSLNRTEHLREIERAKKTVEEKKEERKAEEERRTKAEQIISMCNQHAGDIEASLRQVMAKIATLKKEQDSVREQMEILFCNMTDNNHKLTSESDKKGELLIKLQSQSTEKSRVEAEIANTERERVVVLREMEEFRQQMDFARRKLEYYKQRKAMTATNGLDYEYRDFSKEELNDATDGFSENMMIYRSSEGAVYKGKILQSSVAIKLKNADVQSLEEFKAQVNLLSHANHPHIVTMIGACTELRCIVFEYMNHGSLQNVLFPAASSFSSNQHLINLPWHSRIQIISSLCSALGFLLSSQPNPTAHGRLDSSHVLLDHNLTAKIIGIRTINSDNLATAMDDIKALGLLILQLLTGIREIDFQEMKQVAEAGTIEMVLDRRAAGDWPIDFALEFARIGLRCFEGDEEEGVMVIGRVMNEVEDLRVKAEHKMLHEEGGNRREEDVPSVFLCPIFQVLLTKVPSLPLSFQETPNKVQELSIARDIYEHAVVLSVKVEDQDAFERDFCQLKPYYTDTRGIIPQSPQEYPILGLNLLRLLVQNRIAEFHIELELLTASALENPCIKHAVELEQSFMEGAYNRVLSARQTVPHETYVYFMDLLAKTVRDEIAGCSEKTYDYLSISNAKKILMFSTDQELSHYITEEHPDWEIKNGCVYFVKAKESQPCKEIPSLQLINQTLSYAKELERIV